VVITVTPELAERIRRVRILLATLDEPYPQPRIAVEPDSGPAASKRVPCTACERRGCIVCDQTGWRRRRAGEEEWDEYVDAPISEAIKPIGISGVYNREESIRRLGQEIAKLEADAAAREGRYDHERYGWEKQLAARDRHGSYAELGRALERLRSEWDEFYSALRSCYFVGIPVAMSEGRRLRVDCAEALLATWMRGQIRSAAVGRGGGRGAQAGDGRQPRGRGHGRRCYRTAPAGVEEEGRADAQGGEAGDVRRLV
jgi:hypothetical protein